MAESRSTSVSLEIYSSRAKGCRQVFPHQIVRPLGKKSVDHHKCFYDFINDLVGNDYTIEQYIADNLKRAIGKKCLCHSSLYACEYCFSKASQFVSENASKDAKKHFEKIRKKVRNAENSLNVTAIEAEIEKAEKNMKGNRRSHLVWPSSTINGEPRTHEKILEIAERTEEEGKLPRDEAKGVVGKSALFYIPGFDIVIDVPTEYLHCVCLGTSKRLIELTFSVGENRFRITKRKLSSPLSFNVQMRQIKVFRECSRRNRELDFAVMKGEEFRNITIFFFPLVINSIEKKAKERKLWLLYAYMIRSCILPEKEFNAVNLDDIYMYCELFYKLYEALFGVKNCTYNTHVVSSHLMDMRVHGPLTFTSAFGFESFYGEIRRSFVPGTQSTVKQIMSRILMKRALSYHSCEAPIYYSAHETALENNSLIYCFKDLQHKMFKICDVRKSSVICQEIGKHRHSFSELPKADWAKVGVYKKGMTSDTKVKLLKSKIDGKVLEVGKLMITCPNNVLRDK